MDGPVMVRFFAVTDENSDLGDLSIAFVDGIATLGLPVRVLSSSGAAQLQPHNQSRWLRHADLFATPMIAPYVNVVCGGPDAWKKLFTIGAGVLRNVLITSVPPGGDGTAQALHYQGLVVPTEALADAWRAAGAHPIVIPTAALATAATLRAALAG